MMSELTDALETGDELRDTNENTRIRIQDRESGEITYVALNENGEPLHDTRTTVTAEDFHSAMTEGTFRPDEILDVLTEDGILTTHADITREHMADVHGEPVAETSERVIYADTSGHSLNEWADALGVNRTELSEKMHELAREHHSRDDTAHGGDPWSVADPIVFDAKTFQ